VFSEAAHVAWLQPYAAVAAAVRCGRQPCSQRGAQRALQALHQLLLARRDEGRARGLLQCGGRCCQASLQLQLLPFLLLLLQLRVLVGPLLQRRSLLELPPHRRLLLQLPLPLLIWLQQGHGLLLLVSTRGLLLRPHPMLLPLAALIALSCKMLLRRVALLPAQLLLRRRRRLLGIRRPLRKVATQRRLWLRRLLDVLEPRMGLLRQRHTRRSRRRSLQRPAGFPRSHAWHQALPGLVRLQRVQRRGNTELLLAVVRGSGVRTLSRQLVQLERGGWVLLPGGA
jgi:hypothetical protein